VLDFRTRSDEVQLWDLEALGTIVAGVFTLNIVGAAIVTAVVTLLRTRRFDPPSRTPNRSQAGRKGADVG
jgi:hypothetical protein